MHALLIPPPQTYQLTGNDNKVMNENIPQQQQQ